MISLPFLIIRQLFKSYGEAAALADFDLAVARGAFHAVVGTEAVSRWALLQLIAGFEAPDSGQIILDGKDLGLKAPGQRGVMTIPRNLALFPHLTVRQNIGYPLQQRHLSAAEIAARVVKQAEIAHLGMKLLDQHPPELSPIDRLRVALARALIAEPHVLLLDAPVDALAGAERKQALSEIKEMHRAAGVTVVLAGPDLAEAMTLADRVTVLQDGRDVQTAAPNDIYYRPGNAFIAMLSGDNNLLPIDVEDVLPESVVFRCAAIQPANGTLPRTHVHANLAKGRNWMMVRPELVRLYLGIRRFDCQLEGEIVERFHRGPMLQLRIKAPGLDQPLIVDVPTPPPAPVDIGRRVTLGWNRADTYLLPREDRP